MDLYQVAEIELVYKRGCKASHRPKISKSEDAYRILLDQWDENKLEFVEQAKMLLMNRANCVLGIIELSTGGIHGTVIDPKLVFATALIANACTIVLAHNHPSGNLNPSPQDKQITQQIIEAGNLLGIEVIDHLIITDEGYYSFAEDTSHKKADLKGVFIYNGACPM